MLTPSQRRLRAKAAALALHAAGGTNTKSAFDTRMRNLEARVDPERTLSPEERDRRVRLALRAEMTALAFKASRARSRRNVVEAAHRDAAPDGDQAA